MKNKLLIAGLFIMSTWLMHSCKDSPDKDKDTTEMKSPMVVHPQNDTMGSGHTETKNDLMQSMIMMMRNMTNMKMSGDYDLDFANMMVMHHEGAVDMARIELSKGVDSQAKSMARMIVDKQTTEIQQLQDIIKTHKPEGKKEMNDVTHDELTTAMGAMMEHMKKTQMTGNTDNDFVSLMIPHHESAVKMAMGEISHGRSAQLKSMAQKMITDQKKEIADLKAWLAAH